MVWENQLPHKIGNLLFAITNRILSWRFVGEFLINRYIVSDKYATPELMEPLSENMAHVRQSRPVLVWRYKSSNPLKLFHLRTEAILSHTMYQSNCFRKPTPPQNRQLNIWIRNSKQSVNDFVGELTFWNHLIDTFCEMRIVTTQTSRCGVWDVGCRE